MSTVAAKNATIGDGIPKVCVPIVANTKEKILADALDIVNSQVDIVKWCVNWFESAPNIGKMRDVLEQLSSVLNQVPLLFTLRTAREGGKTDLSSEAYLEINQATAATGQVDLTDIGVLDKETIATKMIESTHVVSVRVVGSNHQFGRTPSQEEVVGRLRRIRELGADICKTAVMPQNETDAIRLLEAASIMYQKYVEKPLVTMFMVELGIVSRIMSEIFGSALTFGTVKRASASGQIESETFYQILQDIHKVL